MKKYALLIITTMMILTFCACNGGKGNYISISENNWNEYFELKEEVYWYKNQSGHAEFAEIGYAIHLKPEYADAVISKDELLGFKIGYTPVKRSITLNPEKLQCEKGKKVSEDRDEIINIKISTNEILNNNNPTFLVSTLLNTRAPAYIAQDVIVLDVYGTITLK